MNSHANIIVNGIVQGVGFRWFVDRNVRKLDLKGFVENRYDGTVYVEVEGERSLIEEFIKQLQLGPRGAQVNDVAVEWSDAKNLFLGFKIKS